MLLTILSFTHIFIPEPVVNFFFSGIIVGSFYPYRRSASDTISSLVGNN